MMSRECFSVRLDMFDVWLQKTLFRILELAGCCVSRQAGSASGFLKEALDEIDSKRSSREKQAGNL